MLFTNAANDIFKLFSESLEVARAKGFRDLIKQIIKLLKELIGQYQEALGTIIEVRTRITDRDTKYIQTSEFAF